MTKVFCIGRNKTGTTSIEKVLKDFDYNLGDQAKAEMLLPHYMNWNIPPILEYCKTADAFQDAPFSWPNTWVVLREHFPDAKFILTVRDKEQWYKSITTFHSKMFADSKCIPTKKDLQNATYRYKGFVWETNRAVWKTPESDVYNKEQMIANYDRHNDSILHFFKNDNNFIKIDVSNNDDYFRLCDFLNKKPIHKGFPHLNKTKG